MKTSKIAAATLVVLALSATVSGTAYAAPDYSNPNPPTSHVTWVTGTGATLRGALYQSANYGGYAIKVYGSTACDNSSLDASFSSMNYAGNYGWNDNVSSLQALANCNIKLFWNTGFGGTSTSWLASTYYVGDAWNDRASSVQFS